MSNARIERAQHDVAGARLPDAAIIERAISAIGGVCGARIIVEPGEGIKELHVLASPRRAPKKIIRDIESLLLVQHGYRIDYRRISLAQVAESSPATVDRIELGRINCVRTPQGVFLEVDVLDGQGTYCGRYPLADDPAHAAAMASVTAINGIFAPAAPIEVCGVQCSTIGMRQVVTVYVVYNRTEHLLGTAFVRSAVSTATARAVLAATNRRLTDWLQGQVSCAVAEPITA